MTTHVGRRAHSPYEISVTVRLPRNLVDQVDLFADAEFCIRAVAIRTLLERGLGLSERIMSPAEARKAMADVFSRAIKP